jgi:hypothetical protein
MDKLFSFMEGPVGRGVRIGLGVLLIVFGLARIGGPGGVALAAIGLIPIAMGIWGPCLLHLALPGRRSAGRS